MHTVISTLSATGSSAVRLSLDIPRVSTVPILAEALQDPDARVRGRAIEAVMVSDTLGKPLTQELKRHFELDDKAIDVVVELIGGTDLARGLVLRAPLAALSVHW